MKPRFYLVFIISVALIVAIFSGFQGEQAQPITEGDAFLLAPSDSLLAVRALDGQWAVHDRDGNHLLALETDEAPIWIEGLPTNRILIAKGASLLLVDPVTGSRTLVAESTDPGRTLSPVQALDGARALVVRREGSDITAFGILCCREAERRVIDFCEPFADSGSGRRIAQVRSSPRGEPVMVTIRDGAYFRSVAFDRSGPGGKWAETFTLPDLNHPEVFFSPSGAFVLFSSVDHGVELKDLRRREEPLLIHWPGIVPTGVTPFRVFFTRNEHRVYIPLEDGQGYRQIFSFDTLSGERKRFTHGWLDHYGIRLSRDDRFILYHQGELPSEPLIGNDRLSEEDLYLYDFPGHRSIHLGARPLRVGGRMTGPCFSGDLRDVFFAAEGWIYRVTL